MSLTLSGKRFLFKEKPPLSFNIQEKSAQKTSRLAIWNRNSATFDDHFRPLRRKSHCFSFRDVTMSHRWYKVTSNLIPRVLSLPRERERTLGTRLSFVLCSPVLVYIMQHVTAREGDVVRCNWLCATVSTGLESVAVSECWEKLDCKSMREGRGRVEGPEGVKWEWDWPKIWMGKWDLIHWTGIFVLGMGLKTPSGNGSFVLTHWVKEIIFRIKLKQK